MTQSKKDLRRSQVPGPTDMSDGVMTTEKDSVKLLSPCSSSKTDIIPLYEDSGQCLKKQKKQQAIAVTNSSEFKRALSSIPRVLFEIGRVIRRVHNKLGHPASTLMLKILREAGAEDEIVDNVKGILV